MKTGYIAAALVALVLWKRMKANAAPPQTKVGELGEDAILDGTNWTGSLWGRYTGALDLTDRSAPNVTGTPSADFSGYKLAQAGIAGGWDGSL